MGASFESAPMPLTAVAARNAVPREKPYKLAAGAGLYLEVMPTGARYWRWKYRYAGKEKRLALGVFPTVSLADARAGADKARALLRAGTDPGEKRRIEKVARKVAASNSFEAVAREWLDRRVGKGHKAIAAVTIAKNRWLLESFAIPTLGPRPIDSITAPDLLAMLRKVEHRGHLETAQRLRVKCSQVFRYAIVTGRATRDPTADLRGALKTPTAKHHASITEPTAVGALLRALHGYDGQPVTVAALKLAPLVFVRPGELRKAEWSEFDLKASEWRIPGARMKMGQLHIVPLSAQAVAILKDLQELTGTGRYVFPSARSPRRPMSENAVNSALRRMGYAKDEATGHGFRSTASTLLNEAGWNRDAIERQLAHAERDRVRGSYNFAEHLSERREMMGWWGHFLDGLRNGANVVPIRRKVG